MRVLLVEDDPMFLRTSTEQALSLMRRTNQSVQDFQNAFSQLVSQQTNQLTTQIRNSAQEVGRRTEQGAAEARMTAQHAADAVQQASSGLEGGSRSKRHA